MAQKLSSKTWNTVFFFLFLFVCFCLQLLHLRFSIAILLSQRGISVSGAFFLHGCTYEAAGAETLYVLLAVVFYRLFKMFCKRSTRYFAEQWRPLRVVKTFSNSRKRSRTLAEGSLAEVDGAPLREIQ